MGVLLDIGCQWKLTLLDETFTDLLKLAHRTGTPIPIAAVTVPYIKGSSETINFFHGSYSPATSVYIHD